MQIFCVQNAFFITIRMTGWDYHFIYTLCLKLQVIPRSTVWAYRKSLIVFLVCKKLLAQRNIIEIPLKYYHHNAIGWMNRNVRMTKEAIHVFCEFLWNHKDIKLKYKPVNNHWQINTTTRQSSKAFYSTGYFIRNASNDKRDFIFHT